MNYAHIGNVVFERGDEESVPDFSARVRETVADLGGGVLAWGMLEGLEWIEAAPEVIDIAGGLKDDATDDFAKGRRRADRTRRRRTYRGFSCTRTCEGVWSWPVTLSSEDCRL